MNTSWVKFGRFSISLLAFPTQGIPKTLTLNPEFEDLRSHYSWYHTVVIFCFWFYLQDVNMVFTNYTKERIEEGELSDRRGGDWLRIDLEVILSVTMNRRGGLPSLRGKQGLWWDGVSVGWDGDNTERDLLGLLLSVSDREQLSSQLWKRRNRSKDHASIWPWLHSGAELIWMLMEHDQ